MLKAMTEKSYAFSTIFLVTNFWKKRTLFLAKMSHAENFEKLQMASFKILFFGTVSQQ